MSSQDPLISLCMIVKNEEKNISRCLESVINYVDEILIFDTGSTDETPELAQQLGAVVRYGTWDNDFSKARNESIKHARGEWILFLDADEEIPEETGRTLRGLAQEQEVEAYTFSILNFTTKEKDSQKQIGINLRMFKNNPLYTFEGKVHEQVKPSILRSNPSAEILHSGLTIIHYGYCTDNENRKEKTLRNIMLLQEAVTENPMDDFSHYNLAVSYYVNGQLEIARKHFQLAKQQCSLKAKYLPALFRNYAVCLFDLDHYEDALSLLNEGLAYYPDYPDLYYLKGQIFTALHLYNYAQQCFENCLKFTNVNPGYVSTYGVESFLSLEYLADICSYRQNWSKALEYQLLAVCTGAKSNISARRLALLTRQIYKKNSDLYSFLQENLPHLRRQEMLNILFTTGCYDLVLQELEVIEGNNPRDFLLGAKAQMHLKNWEGAEGYLQLELIPNNNTDYKEAQVLGFICCCLQSMDAAGYISRIELYDSSLAEACKSINNLFLYDSILPTSHCSLTPYFSDQSLVTSHYLNLIYQLMLYDSERTLDVCKNYLETSDFAFLCSAAGKIAFNSGNLDLSKLLFLLALSLNYRSPDIYRLLGEILIYSGEKTEGLYFIRQATFKEPDKSENYVCLLKHFVDNFTEQLREILNLYPHLGLPMHHLCALTTFRAKLEGKEVFS